MGTKWTNYDGLHFAGWGHPSPSIPPSSLLHSFSLLFSLWQFNFPLSPLCSCLLIVSEALSLGPPSTLGPRYRRVWERRLECQNVIWDSQQPERRRSHTIRLDVHLDARVQPQHRWTAWRDGNRNPQLSSLQTTCVIPSFMSMLTVEFHFLSNMTDWLQQSAVECQVSIKFNH